MDFKGTLKPIICQERNGATTDTKKELLAQTNIHQIGKKGFEPRTPGVTLKSNPV